MTMPPAAPRRTVTMTFSLAASFGLLVLVAVGTVLAVALYGATRNTVTLLRDTAALTDELLFSSVQDHFGHVELQVRDVARAVAEGRVTPALPGALGRYLHGAMAGMPEVHALLFVDPDLQVIGAERRHAGDHEAAAGQAPAGTEEEIGRVEVVTAERLDDPALRAALPALIDGDEPRWIGLHWNAKVGEAQFILVVPVHRVATYVGSVIAMVGTDELSHFLATVDRATGTTTFMLLDHTAVLAHAAMDANLRGLSAARPLPPLAGYSDHVLAAMWDRSAWLADSIPMRPPLRNHSVMIDGVRYEFLYREIEKFAGEPLVIGAYLPFARLNREVERLRTSALFGLAALLVGVFAAYLLGRRIARPVKRLSLAAEQVGALRLDAVEPLPGSRITELNQQSRAFNAMVAGLRWFEVYVPKTLVRRLLSRDRAGVADETRDLTVLFTDIVGFSTYAEDKPADAIAAFLNRHFAIVAGCIEAEGGTVDKFIGDSVMAFWGAPDAQVDRAERACRAALAIDRALAADNARRAAAGEEPVRIRIGIHSGRATVGNIGSPGRINYTVVGDMVNVASRMESLGRELVTEPRAATILITEATRAELSAAFAPRSLGRQRVKGRAEPIEVYELRTPRAGE